MDSPNIYNVASIINNVIMLCGFFILKGRIRQTMSAAQLNADEAQLNANEAQQSAIEAQQSELDTLRGRIDDLRTDNSRHQHILQTICSALKSEGIVIAIDGEIVNIKSASGSFTSMRIQEEDMR
jgi:RecJ-like exonuclease